MYLDDNFTSQHSMECKLNFVQFCWLLNTYGMPFHESNTGHHRFSIIFRLILLSKDRQFRISRADVYIILHLQLKYFYKTPIQGNLRSRIFVQKFKFKQESNLITTKQQILNQCVFKHLQTTFNIHYSNLNQPKPNATLNIQCNDKFTRFLL